MILIILIDIKILVYFEVSHIQKNMLAYFRRQICLLCTFSIKYISDSLKLKITYLDT